MSSYDDYVKKAQQQYDPQYNNQVNQLKSSLASAMAGYDRQTSDTNTSYDTSVKNQNLGTQQAEQNYNTNTLGRGIGRSTIYTSGVAGLDDKNTRLVGNINTDRNAKLGQIGLDRTNTNNTYNTNLTQLGTNRDNQIATLARQLQQTDWDNAYKQQQLELQRQSEARQAAAQAASIAASKAATTGQGISEVNPWVTMQDILSKYGYGGMINFLQDNKSSLISSSGQGEYDKMRQYATGVQKQIIGNNAFNRRSKSW